MTASIYLSNLALHVIILNYRYTGFNKNFKTLPYGLNVIIISPLNHTKILVVHILDSGQKAN